jgi:hypothetical protein
LARGNEIGLAEIKKVGKEKTRKKEKMKEA